MLINIVGLKLQGATCKKNKLQLSTTISTELPVTLLRWIRCVQDLCQTSLILISVDTYLFYIVHLLVIHDEVYQCVQ